MYPVPERKAQGGGWLEDGDHDEFAELFLTADDQGLVLLHLLPLVKDSRQECEQPNGDVWFFLLIIIECGGAGEPPFFELEPQQFIYTAAYSEKEQNIESYNVHLNFTFGITAFF